VLYQEETSDECSDPQSEELQVGYESIFFSDTEESEEVLNSHL